MVRKSAQGLGPYPMVLAGLFVLSVLAIHTWRVEHGPDPRLLDGTAELGDAVAARPLGEQDLALDLPESMLSPEDSPASDVEFGEAPGPRPIDLSLLDALAIPRIRSRVAPPVADRVSAIADLPEPPALPPPPDVPAETARIAARARRRVEPLRHGILPLLPRQDATLTYRQPAGWPHAATLVRQFETLSELEPCAAWSRQVLALLAELERSSTIGSPDSARLLVQLGQAVQDAPLANAPVGSPVAGQIARARYALDRRLVIWRQVQSVVLEEPAMWVSLEAGDVASSLPQIDKLLPPVDRALGWREYLLVDQVKLLAAAPEVDPLARRLLAQRVLERLSQGSLSQAQQQFLAQASFVSFGDQLRRWAYEPLDYSALLQQLESLEDGDTLSESEVAEGWRQLRWSPWSQTSVLAQTIDTHYRNANIRVAVSGEFINRMLPAVEAIDEPVDDHILGTPVTGRSTTMGRLFVELVPDKLRWRLGLVARGNIDSETWSEKGPVTLFTNGATRYQARKLLTIDGTGIKFQRAEAQAANDAELTDVATDFDGVPLLGSFMRSLARRGHAERMGEANAEVESKVGSRVAQRLDDEVAAKIHDAEEKYREKLLQPLRELQLNPTPLDMQTTDRRLIVRYRLAADHQLAAHTPRPNAPGDSVLSAQIHESAINNTIEQLRLDGRQVSLVDLYRELSAKFGKNVEPPADIPDNILLAFAEEDAVRVRFHEGRVELTLRFRAMQAGQNLWENFEVFTKLTPEVSGRLVRLVRDDVIELRGQLGFRDRLPMRAIFTAMLARERAMPILDPEITTSPKLEGIGVSQFVVVDGWIGVALSPEPRVATQEGPVRVSVSDRPQRR